MNNHPLGIETGIVVARTQTMAMQPQPKGNAMPSVKNELYPSKYLSAADLQNRDVAVTIVKVEMEEFEDNGRKVTKPVVHFQGSPKAMIFNKTNATTVADITGQDDTDHWGGARICLYSTMVQFGSKMTEAIRVKRVPEVAPAAPAVAAPMPAIAPEPTAAPAIAATPQVDPELNDEIPWT